MKKLQRGLYEQLITGALAHELSALAPELAVERSTLDAAEAPDRIALHLQTLVRRAVASLGDPDRKRLGRALVNEITAILQRDTNAVEADDQWVEPGEVLRAILAPLPNGMSAHIAPPATPLLDTTLLTNAPGEPNIGYQIKTEIESADRIDVIMAFVRRSGIGPLLERLQRHVQDGRALRVITTTYTGSTELAALVRLADIGADVRVSDDTTTTRLHAKAWLFHRGSGFSTAYIGSSNLTYSAQVSGLEWNVRVAQARNPDLVEKFSAMFESYWEGGDFRPFKEDEFRELTAVRESGPRIYLSPVEIRPEPFQSRLLEQIALARQQGRHSNLLVAATGTGKTVMAALDYQRLQRVLPRSRLLFVAHHKEILEQSLATFRHALRDAAFGELWVGGDQPRHFDHVFASVQSLTASGIRHIAPDHFDVVIIDEFHHAAAKTYSALIDHLKPKELLGLTATPERGDQQSILHWFDDRITAELRLWDAIDQQRLCPFAYHGIADGTNFRGVTWRRGRGYDAEEMSRLVTGNTVLARLILTNVERTVPDMRRMRALGFCVSVAHARFMADQFNQAHVPALAVWAQTPTAEREQALKALASGKLRVIFSVDLFNEGVDIPSVNTLLLLRPTDSATVFLQQLGRGLRRGAGKTVCTVLDFIGQHRKEFRFARRFGALLGGTRKRLERQIQEGFPFLPSGSQMELDPVATEVVLDNIRQSLPSTWPAKADELRRMAQGRSAVSLQWFLEESGLTLDDVYSSGRSWSDLLEQASLPVLAQGPHERALRRALGRLLHIDDAVRIDRYRAWARSDALTRIESLPLYDQRVFHMLATVLLDSVKLPNATLQGAAEVIWQHPQIRSELCELLDVLHAEIDHVVAPLNRSPDVPLSIHARYTRREILAAFSDGDQLQIAEWREGVRWLPEHKVDLLAFTLDKTSGHFSPTTRYRDYAISPTLLHWESQAGARADSPTGQRYQQHQKRGSVVLPFARLATNDRAFWLLGPATYVRHEGERPMAITWRLERPLPGDLFTQFAAAAA